MPSSFEQFKRRALAGPDVRKVYDELEDEFAYLDDDLVARAVPSQGIGLTRAGSFDAAFHAGLSATLSEWTSPEDDEAFRDL